MSREQKRRTVPVEEYKAMAKLLDETTLEHHRLRLAHAELEREFANMRDDRDAFEHRVRQLEADLVAERRSHNMTREIGNACINAWAQCLMNEAQARARNVAEMGASWSLQAFAGEPVPSVKVEVTP